uniref:Uncharacterized protein n=1 Tax=Lepeophtheirus salmonis TaxID=72036 RepID=A0A0K2V9N1_LEPSM
MKFVYYLSLNKIELVHITHSILQKNTSSQSIWWGNLLSESYNKFVLSALMIQKVKFFTYK